MGGGGRSARSPSEAGRLQSGIWVYALYTASHWAFGGKCGARLAGTRASYAAVIRADTSYCVSS